MRVAVLFSIFSLVSFWSLAQHTSGPNGTFTVDQVMGCAPFTVTVSAPTCDGSVGCDVAYTGDFNDTQNSNTILLTDTHTYTQPGVYTLQLVRGVQVDEIQIEVVENTIPQFQLSTCSNNRVSLSILENVYDEYVVNFGDGSPTEFLGPMATRQHVYATAGTKLITVRGRNAGAQDNCSSSVQSFNAVAALSTPVISRLEVIDDERIALQFNGQPNVQYRLEISVNNNPTFQTLRTLVNTTLDTIKNLRTDDNYYCVRISAFDPCSNALTSSPVVCSTNFDLELLNNENRLTWSPAPGPTVTGQEVEIIPVGSGTSIRDQVGPSTSTYSDVNISCGTEYCYRLTVDYPQGGKSISQMKCGVAISTDIPDPVRDVSAIVGRSGGVELIWQPVAGFTPEEFSVFRVDGTNLDLVGTTTDLTIEDAGYDFNNPDCYKIRYRDVCGNQSPEGPEVCPIVLTATLQENNDVALSWTPYAGWSSGIVNYQVEKYDQSGQVLLERIDAGQNTSITDVSQDLDNQVYIYVIVAVSVDGYPESVSNPVTIIKDPNLFYPSAFTPNGDGLNDIFNVFGQYIATFQMDIFNRWGELMYTTTDLEQGWDGKYKTIAMPEGTYTFVATIKDNAGRTFEKSGSILLLEKNR